MSARVRSDLFVSALLRRIFAAGDFAAVLSKGSEEAGAIFLRHRHRDGSETLYGPAPQALLAENADRRFERRLTALDPAALDAAMERELRFDPDLWLVEIEADSVDGLVTVVEGQE